ncbi:cytochrome c553 [Burkholderia pseudomallei]|nr:cytochrome c553 [Burkholderia pseudomallei]
MMANIPSLNGQHSAYIIDQLNRFASGERQAMMMGGIAAALSDSDKQAIAEFLSNHP